MVKSLTKTVRHQHRSSSADKANVSSRSIKKFSGLTSHLAVQSLKPNTKNAATITCFDTWVGPKLIKRIKDVDGPFNFGMRGVFLMDLLRQQRAYGEDSYFMADPCESWQEIDLDELMEPFKKTALFEDLKRLADINKELAKSQNWFNRPKTISSD